MDNEDNNANDAVNDFEMLAWSCVHRMISRPMRQDLEVAGLWSDIEQVVAVAAIVGKGLQEEGVVAVYNAMSRCVADAIRDMGYYRPNCAPGFVRSAISLACVDNFMESTGNSVSKPTSRDDGSLNVLNVFKL